MVNVVGHDRKNVLYISSVRDIDIGSWCQTIDTADRHKN